MATASNLMLLAIEKLIPSKTNPRKTFPPAYISELAGSIKSNGVLQPIIARAINGGGKFEIVVGECRYRAAKEAGLTEIPAIVRSLGDGQVMEIQIIENLQRRDVHPLEEGLGYKTLLSLKGTDKQPLYTIDSLAAKLSKSTSYIYQRLKLADLTEGWQKELTENGGRFTAGHAILVARLRPEQQEKLRKDFWKKDWDGEWPSVRNIDDLIHRDLFRRLSAAPFKTTDETYQVKAAAAIHPDAKLIVAGGVGSGLGTLPACTGCQFNGAVNRLAYPEDDPKNPQCHNAPCYEAKINVHLVRKQEELRAQDTKAVMVTRDYSLSQDKAKQLPNVVTASQYTEVKKNARGAVPALVVDGRDRGTVTYIVPSAKESSAAARRQPTAAERQESLEADVKRAFKVDVLLALMKAVKLDDSFLTRVAAFCLHEGFDQIQRKRVFGETFEKAYGEAEIARLLKGKSRAELLGYMAAGVWGTDATASYSEGRAVMEAAKEFGVDLKAVEKKTRSTPAFQKRQHDIKEQAAREAAKKKQKPATVTTLKPKPKHDPVIVGVVSDKSKKAKQAMAKAVKKAIAKRA